MRTQYDTCTIDLLPELLEKEVDNKVELELGRARELCTVFSEHIKHLRVLNSSRALKNTESSGRIRTLDLTLNVGIGATGLALFFFACQSTLYEGLVGIVARHCGEYLG